MTRQEARHWRVSPRHYGPRCASGPVPGVCCGPSIFFSSHGAQMTSGKHLLGNCICLRYAIRVEPNSMSLIIFNEPFFGCLYCLSKSMLS